MEASKKKENRKKCGIIMPIASHSEYPKEHWKEVLTILVEAISETEFEPRLVSDDVAVGLIHERIVNNIYNDDIVVCDVSSKNPNVMFELGLRLAFDKPTIIIKDEKTGYSFDTGIIEHINYPSSLRFNQIVEFKEEIIRRINATYERSVEEKNYSPFLKSFGKTIVPAKINSTEIAESSYIISKLELLTNEVQLIRATQNNQEPDLSEKSFAPNSFARRAASRKLITNFLGLNNHLKEEEIIQNFIPILKGEIDAKFGYRPSSLEVVTIVKAYFSNKETELINNEKVVDSKGN